MKIFILGSEGFIGSHCIAYFSKLNYEVHGADLYDQATPAYKYYKISRLSPELDEIIANEQFDGIINAAGSSNVPYSMTHPILDFEANCLDTIRLLEGLKKHQPDTKYIHFSSAAVYGNPKSLPIKESDPVAPLSAYGWHKWLAENICKEYTQLYNLRTAVVRPFSVYGPGLKKQFFWDLFQKLNQSPSGIELWGTGSESRDYIYIQDLIEGIHTILTSAPMRAEVYNLASGLETTIKQASNTFMDALQATAEVHFNGKIRPGDPLNWRADITAIKNLGFTPQYSLSEGLSELSQWINTYRVRVNVHIS